MDERLIVPLHCAACGAPLDESLACAYCGTRHARVRRYNGPELDEPQPKNTAASSQMLSSSSAIFTSRVTYTLVYGTVTE